MAVTLTIHHVAGFISRGSRESERILTNPQEHFNVLFRSLLGLAPKGDPDEDPDAIVDTIRQVLMEFKAKWNAPLLIRRRRLLWADKTRRVFLVGLVRLRRARRKRALKMWEGVELEQQNQLAQIWELPSWRKRMIALAPRKKKLEVIAQMHRHRIAQASEEFRTWFWHSRELRQEQRHLSRQVARLWLSGQLDSGDIVGLTTRLHSLRATAMRHHIAKPTIKPLGWDGLTARELQTWYVALHPLAVDLTAIVAVDAWEANERRRRQAELLKADTRIYKGPAKKRYFKSDIESPSQIAGVQGHVQRMDRARSLSEEAISPEATSPEASSSCRTVSGPPNGAGEPGLMVEHPPQRNSIWDIIGPDNWAPDVDTAGDAADDGEGRGHVARSLRVDTAPLRKKLGYAPALAIPSDGADEGRRSDSACAGTSPPSPTFFWTATTSPTVSWTPTSSPRAAPSATPMHRPSVTQRRRMQSTPAAGGPPDLPQSNSSSDLCAWDAATSDPPRLGTAQPDHGRPPSPCSPCAPGPFPQSGARMPQHRRPSHRVDSPAAGARGTARAVAEMRSNHLPPSRRAGWRRRWTAADPAAGPEAACGAFVLETEDPDGRRPSGRDDRRRSVARRPSHAIGPFREAEADGPQRKASACSVRAVLPAAKAPSSGAAAEARPALALSLAAFGGEFKFGAPPAAAAAAEPYKAHLESAEPHLEGPHPNRAMKLPQGTLRPEHAVALVNL